MMKKQVVGNAQLFMVVKDVEENCCVGMNIVVKDPVLLVNDYTSGVLPQLTLTGSLLESAMVDLPDDLTTFGKTPEYTYEFITDEKSLNA